MSKKGYAVIGCGARIRGLVRLLGLSKKVKLIGGWDPIAENTKLLLKAGRGGKIYASEDELLADPEVAWVLIGSPNVFHADQIIKAFKAGKHVFAEKPLATTIDDCERVIASQKDSGLLFATGFTLRFASIYQRVKRLLSSGLLGKIISVAASENIKPNHGTYIFTNWRRKKELSGPHILEKCVHDLDLLNWFCESLPEKISAMGGKLFFIPENAPLKQKYPQVYKNPFWGKNAGDYEKGGDDPFLSDSTIEDHVTAVMSLASGAKVSFQATVSNMIPERRMYFHCTQGNLIVELYSGILRYRRSGQKFTRRRRFIGGGHGDGDIRIIRSLIKSMVDGVPPVCSGLEGLNSAVVAAGIEEARISGEVVDLKPVWNRL